MYGTRNSGLAGWLNDDLHGRYLPVPCCLSDAIIAIHFTLFALVEGRTLVF